MSEQGPEEIPMGQWNEVQAIDGAAECLQVLHGGLPLAIATNASVSRRPMIELALSRVGFAGYFDQVFCYTEIGFRKNQAEFWQAVERGLRVPLQHIAMVGDSYEHDAVHPRKFGVQAVWFNHRGAVQREVVDVPMVEHLSLFAGWAKNAT